jgi:hypothetical protein
MGGSARGKHTHEVAIPYRAFGQFFAFTASRSQQIAQYHRFEFGTKLVLGGRWDRCFLSHRYL